VGTDGAESWNMLRDAALPRGSLSHEVVGRRRSQAPPWELLAARALAKRPAQSGLGIRARRNSVALGFGRPAKPTTRRGKSCSVGRICFATHKKDGNRAYPGRRAVDNRGGPFREVPMMNALSLLVALAAIVLFWWPFGTFVFERLTQGRQTPTPWTARRTEGGGTRDEG
jgi:hypothetical protein